MVGDWKSLLSNLGGTGPDPALGRCAEAVMLLVDAAVLGGTGPAPALGISAEAVVLLVDAAVLEEVDRATGSADTEGELEPYGMQEGSPVAGALDDETATVSVDKAEALDDETATIGVDEAEAPGCACLACFLLAAAFVCHPHEHGLDLSAERKNDPCRHFLIEAIAAKTSLLDGFWPLPVNAGRPSARSINRSAYCPMPRKWCDRDISASKTQAYLTPI